MYLNDVILLTSCVDPKGMGKTALTDIEVRKKQYIETLWYYIKTTDKKIVVVDNSNTDFSAEFYSYIAKNRLEFLIFDGNDYDRELGKGYGEMKILDFALRNSKFIKNSYYVIKITGRLIIPNFQEIDSEVGKTIKNSNEEWVACDISFSYKFAPSKIFYANKNFISNYLVPNIDMLNDSKGIYFERVLAKMIYKWKMAGNKLHVFSIPVQKEGISGTTGRKIPKPLKIQIVSKKLKHFYFKYISF